MSQNTHTAYFLASAVIGVFLGVLSMSGKYVQIADTFGSALVGSLTAAAGAGVNDCKIVNGVQTCVPLIQPLGNSNTVGVQPGAGTFFAYFNQASGLIFVVAVGFCVLWVLIGSFMIMISGGPSGSMNGAGKEIIKWAIIGLLIVNFAGVILRTLNSHFFTL